MTVTAAPNDPIVFGQSSLTAKIATGAAIEFADAVQQAILTTPMSWAEWNPISGKNLAKPVPSANICQITLAQDLTEGSLFQWLEANQRKRATFVLTPDDSVVASVTFDAYIGRPGTFGGPAGSTATSTADLRLIGEPEYDWAQPTP